MRIASTMAGESRVSRRMRQRYEKLIPSDRARSAVVLWSPLSIMDFQRRARANAVISAPYVSIANRQAEIMMRIASEFGFTPASRGRISAPADHEPTLFDYEKPIELNR